ncbi:hypothetical protein O181_025375 [Austropuccinia psidii MF-1]|uniref:ABC transporter domain-containing protein n=1 Tax=Austropuccinia psidii MF-1 TaxID=1389203 RepID=A0A9Q3CMC3_9BASI|nr:hypothetical protein [Austropuccinia psidii MF-1]
MPPSKNPIDSSFPTQAGYPQSPIIEHYHDTQTGPYTSSASGSGSVVDVAEAERTFAELARQLTQASSIHLSQSGKMDHEKQEPDAAFDLLAYLRGAAQTRDDFGSRPKQLGVIFENLSVIGNGGAKIPITTFFDALLSLFFFPVLAIVKRMKTIPEKTIIHSTNGFLKAGEMCLVLGRPNSGCTTLLKVLANQRAGFKKVDGQVTYGGIPAKIMAKQYKGEVVYNPEDDVHFPTLTVYQTLKFALKTKTPGKLLPNLSNRKFVNQVTDVLLKMLGISHTKHTRVGDAQVRGISGGERKRVSIAEMMATRACVLSWDNSTRGLDASTALEYAKSLRILANIFKITMFVTLYQASEGIYNQFDKVLLLNEGRCVYFGPANQARDYMMSLGYKNLPRQTTADYLTGCTDENERQFQDGIDINQIPKTSEEMEQAYLNSSIHQQMEQERLDYKKFLDQQLHLQKDFMQAVKDDQAKGVSHKSPYTVSVFAQLRALILRDMLLTLQDRATLVIDCFNSVILGLILGSVFWNLPTTSAGIFTRGSALFVSLLFNAFLSFAELPKQMIGRPIMWRQTSFCFYRPGALAMAAAIGEIPFSFFKVASFSAIIYFMAHFYKDVGVFFIFFAIVYVTYYSMSSFFRVLGAISFKYDTASRSATFGLVLMAMYSGYMISKDSMKVWLRWIYYINPINYGFAALMINEFKRLDFTCSGVSIVPRGSTYPTDVGPNQVCTTLGSQPGSQIIRGEDYIRVAFGYKKEHLWLDFGIVCIFCVFFLLVLFVAVECIARGSGKPSVMVFAKENRERRALNKKLQAQKANYRSGKATQELTGLIESKKPLTWEGLTYDVKISGGQKRLLNDIYGYVKPGTLTALMGASGAGKTTLLDVLAKRKTTGVIGGEICIAGKKPGKSFQRATAYCEQQDVHEWTATVREAMRFSAYLRQPHKVTVAEKNAYVEEIIHLLELEDLADAMIGFPGFGIGVEARKRVTIGVELAAKPELLLFLDEPTSGLDGQSAYNIVRFLRKLASAGQAILCTIHQPNALLFENFDRLLLLKAGRCVYFGDIGPDSRHLCCYLARNGAPCPDNANPAEFMLEAIGAGSGTALGGPKDWADRWLESPEHEENKLEILRLKDASLKQYANMDEKKTKERRYATPFYYQLKVVMKRTNLSFFRNADYEVTRVFNHVSIGLLTGLTFLNVSSNIDGLQLRIFAIFQGVLLVPLVMAQVQPTFIMARNTYLREASSKMYSPVAFGIAQLVAEVPYSLFCAVVFFALWYYPTGFNRAYDRSLYAVLMMIAIELLAVSFGQGIAATSPSMFFAAKTNAPLVVVLVMFCGVTVPKKALPSFWRKQLYPINPVTRLIAGLLSNELHNLPITCDEREFSVFQPPIGQTCIQWAGQFLTQAGGYLLNPESTSICQYCQFRVGDEYLQSLELDFNKRWRNWGILFIFIIHNLVLLIVGSAMSSKVAKR